MIRFSFFVAKPTFLHVCFYIFSTTKMVENAFFFAKMNFLLTHIFLCVHRFLHVHAKFHVFSYDPVRGCKPHSSYSSEPAAHCFSPSPQWTSLIWLKPSVPDDSFSLHTASVCAKIICIGHFSYSLFSVSISKLRRIFHYESFK